MVRMKTIAIRVSAAPQARAWAPSYGEVAFAKICDESAVFGAVEERSC